MRSFTFNGVSLSSLSGRITEAPFHTVASRDVEQVKIYGQSGDEVIDNKSYNNVPFSVKIAFLPYKTAQTANDIARAVIDWLAPLQGAYYTYTDSWNDGYFTKARLTNFDEVKRELRTLLTATLKFSREPYWYSYRGAVAITTTNGRLTLTNPEAYAAEPVIKITYTGTATNNHRFYLWINNVLLGYDGIAVGGITPEQYLDGAAKQHYKLSDGQKIYLSNILPPDIPAASASSYAARLEPYTTINGQDFIMSVTPNWRRL